MSFLEIYRIAAVPCIPIIRILTNKISHLSTRKLLVPKNVVLVHIPTCFILTVQGDYLPHFTEYVWLVLSNTLGHNRSCGGGEKKRKQSWNSEQDNVEIMLILDPNIYKPNWNPKMLAFLQSSFLPQVPVKHHTSVCSPFILNTHTHALEPSLPEKVKARNTQSRLESGMRHEFPSTSVSNSASGWDCSVCKCLAAHLHSTWFLCGSSPRQEVPFVLFLDQLVCAQKENSLAHHKLVLCLLIFPWSLNLADPEKGLEKSN